MHASLPLAERLRALGLPLRRFKTGTPPRVNARSVDFSKMERQDGDAEPLPFSFTTEHVPCNQAVCYLTYTNEETHRIIRENLDRSPIYSGVIEGVGPRYCPSIETKIVRFADKPRHQLFIEPMGLDTEELYIQGFSSSMPEDVQVRMLHTVPGLEPRGDDAPRLRHRVRLHRPHRAQAYAGNASHRRGCTARGSSTARPVTRRPPYRALLPA